MEMSRCPKGTSCIHLKPLKQLDHLNVIDTPWEGMVIMCTESSFIDT